MLIKTNFAEENIEPNNKEEGDEIVSWLEENCVFIHNKSETEYILRVPPLIGKEEFIKLLYEMPVPDKIQVIFDSASNLYGGLKNPGMILIWVKSY